MNAAIFSMEGICKAFSGVEVLKNIDFSSRPGEVHALCGENGAGKSTLIKILSGVYRADAGSIFIAGENASFRHPLDALKAGISVMYQEFALLPDRNVTENIFLGREPSRHGIIARKAMHAETVQILETFGADHVIRPDSRILDLGVAQQQIVEIAKAVSVDARIMVMDEPTAALSDHEAKRLFSIIRTLRDKGVSIVYITHRMKEIFELSDRITVIKDGEIVAGFETAKTSAKEVVRSMVGREIGDYYPPHAKKEVLGEPILRLKDAASDSLHDICLTIHSGEIVGIAGLQGAGRTALVQGIFGDKPFTAGEMRLAGDRVHFKSPRDAIQHGVAFLPANRKEEGLLLMQSVRDNAMLSARAMAPLGGSRSLASGIGKAQIDALMTRLDVRAAGFDQQVEFLSGGNQQKVVLSRWLAMASKLIVFAEPTRGIDVGTRVNIYQIMRNLANEGAAVVMVSSDLPEIIGVCDRVLVMHDGTITKAFKAGATEADIMLAATGEVENIVEGGLHAQP